MRIATDETRMPVRCCHVLALFFAALASGNLAEVARAQSPGYWTPFGPTQTTHSTGDGKITSLACNDGSIFVAGEFENVNGVPVGSVAEWDPLSASWQALSDTAGSISGLVTNDLYFIEDIELYASDLYVAGSLSTFNDPGGTPVSGLVRWDPAARSWTSLPFTLSGEVNDLLTYTLPGGGSLLICGGGFQVNATAGAATGPRNNIAAWNGSAWMAIGSGLPFVIEGVVEHAGWLFAHGQGSLSRLRGRSGTRHDSAPAETRVIGPEVSRHRNLGLDSHCISHGPASAGIGSESQDFGLPCQEASIRTVLRLAGTRGCHGSVPRPRHPSLP